MDGSLPPTTPMSPTLRNTLTIMTWAMQGLANADRSRRERLAGGKRITGAEAMGMYLKDHGVDVPHIEATLRGLMQDGPTAAALKDLATLAADAAASPQDLGALVRNLARCCATTTAAPPATAAGPMPPPAAAPPGASWTATWEPGQKPRFRPDLTSAARQRAQASSPPPSPASAPTTPVPTSAPAAAANDCTHATTCKPTTDNTTAAACAHAATNDTTMMWVCTDHAAQGGPGIEQARLDALERRMDALEARITRELEELKSWITAQFQELSRRLAASEAKQARMQVEIDDLRTTLARVESELRAVRADTAAPVASEQAAEPGSAVLPAPSLECADKSRPDAQEAQVSSHEAHQSAAVDASNDAPTSPMPAVSRSIVEPADAAHPIESDVATGPSTPPSMLITISSGSSAAQRESIRVAAWTPNHGLKRSSGRRFSVTSDAMVAY